MAWTSTWPDGSKSVSGNQPTGAANTTYIETTMNLDHYWNVTGNGGYHKQVNMPMKGTAAVPTDASLATGMNGVIYYKAKSTVEAPSNQDVQPFFINNKSVSTTGTTQVMQLLGIRAMGVFSVSDGVITTNYVHNIKPSTNASPGIVRNSTGTFTVTFQTALPSNNYLFLGGCVANGVALAETALNVQGATTLTTSKSSTMVKIITSTTPGSLKDPTQAWFVCFGG